MITQLSWWMGCLLLLSTFRRKFISWWPRAASVVFPWETLSSLHPLFVQILRPRRRAHILKPHFIRSLSKVIWLKKDFLLSIEWSGMIPVRDFFIMLRDCSSHLCRCYGHTVSSVCTSCTAAAHSRQCLCTGLPPGHPVKTMPKHNTALSETLWTVVSSTLVTGTGSGRCRAPPRVRCTLCNSKYACGKTLCMMTAWLTKERTG